MLSHHFTRGRTCFAAALLGLSSSAFAGPPQAAQTDYDELTNTYRSAANFNVETVRGLHVAPSLRVLMINTHGSTLNMWVPGMPFNAPFFWPTLNNPIAVDAYSQPTGPTSAPIEYAVVLGGGTHALALHDLATGRIVSTLQLPAETGDVVVDQEGARAFVSLPGDNTVWQIGLPKLTVDAVFTVASQRPRFLYLDLGGDGVEDNLVYVAPELSSNNTVSFNALQDPVSRFFPFLSGFTLPLDLKPFLPGGLPDEDLFLMKPQPPASGAPPTLAADAVLRNAGTILNAHGRNPVTDAYWIVGVEALNTINGSFAATTEPLVKGKFALNRLTIAPTLSSAPIPHANTFFDLDLVGATYNSIFSISAPYGLAFHPTGYAAISGVASDQIRALDPAGVRVGDIELPPGSMPRSMAFDTTGVFMFVYCWGTNEVRLYDVNALLMAMAGNPNQIAPVGAGYLVSIPLGADPASERIRHGRELFYDGDNSADGRFTCHHCHPGGGMDLIGWNIQDFPHDHKDLMVTQSLKSIEDTFPYHWRGERDLEAFNAAFAGLLGGSKLSEAPGGDFEDFKAFVFSLQAHANPKQALSRKLDPSRSSLQSMFELPPASPPPPAHAIGDPATGQVFMDRPNTLFARFSCAQCHSKVAGSVGDPNVVDVTSTIGTNITMDPAHFRQLTHKNQDVIPIQFAFGGSTFQFNTVRSGYGLSHDGDHSSIFDFLNRNPFDFTQPEKEHLAAFVEQADEGIAPAAHVAYTIDAGTRAAVLTEIDTVVLPQAGATFQASHWVSFAIIGSHRDINGVTRDLTWWFLPATQTFFASDPTVVFPNGATGSQTWTTLKAEAAAGRANFTLLGLPPGSALRFAHDPDDDGLSNHDEGLVGSNRFVRDSDGDGDLDGHEAFNGGDPTNPAIQSNDTTPPVLTFSRVDHTGASYVKYVLVFSEPVTLAITATNATTGHTTVERRFVPRQWDSVTVQRLQASLPAINFAAAPYVLGYPVPPTPGVAYPYTLSIVATDLGGNSVTVAGPGATPTRDQLVGNPFDIAQVGGTPGMPPALLERTVENLTWVGTPGVGPSFQATATAKVRFDVPQLLAAYTAPPNTPNGSSNPYERQVVVAQVLHLNSLTGQWSVVPDASSGAALTVSSPSGRLFSDVLIRGDGSPTPPAVSMAGATIPGPYLLSTPSNASGAVSFDFLLNTPVPAGDKIKLNIVAILEQDTRDPGIPANEFWLPSVTTYNMPNTVDANRGIASP